MNFFVSFFCWFVYRLYTDNDSDEVDVGQIFANNVGNGDVSVDELDLDDGSMQEMSELLNTIARKHKKKKINDNEQITDGQDIDGNEGYVDGQEQDVEVYAVKFTVDSDNDNDDNEDTEDVEEEL